MITSKENLDNLIKSGYCFEACVTQSAIVEFVIFTLIGIYGYENDRKLKDIAINELSKFTLGKMIDI